MLWIEAAYLFGLYLAQFARNYVTVYAGLASVMIVLVFLYTLAVIFIYGAELNAAILHARQGDRRKKAHHPGADMTRLISLVSCLPGFGFR